MGIITTERLTKILSETQAVISEYNARGVHGSVEVNARLFENILMELLQHRAAMLQGAENAESLSTIQTAPTLDSSPKISESLSSNSPVIPDGWALVPEEPTHEMLEAGDEQFGTYDVYRRMIAAAPQQEVKQGPKKK